MKFFLSILPMLVRYVTPDVLQRGTDAFLDVIENACKASENKIDDLIVLPLCRTARAAFGIDDNDLPESDQ